MNLSLLSPCACCDRMLPGVTCGPRRRSRCAKFLSYIQDLHRKRAFHVLITELKELITK
jgi:hypothetical protein